MRLSARTHYALRAAAELAAAPGTPIPAERISKAQRIPRRFLDNILLQLRRSGLISSQRGPDGGYWLARPAAEITLADVILVIEGVPQAEEPFHGAAEPLAKVWDSLRERERQVLTDITLAHIASGSLPDL